jgi:retron-type reverse transcriptase
LKKGLVKKFTVIDKDNPTEKPKTAGIPQGTPISAVLANIYMLEFDKVIHNWLSARGGVYRRYSDDMLFICRKEDEKSLLKKLKQELKVRELSFQDKRLRRSDSIETKMVYSVK